MKNKRHHYSVKHVGKDIYGRDEYNLFKDDEAIESSPDKDKLNRKADDLNYECTYGKEGE